MGVIFGDHRNYQTVFQHIPSLPEEYTAGKYFGELGMLTARPRAAWIMAKTYCVLSVPRRGRGIVNDGHGWKFLGDLLNYARFFRKSG
jgi:hypothetical protein